MFLTEANVLHYLLEKRFASPQDVIACQFTVRSVSRRNLNFHVTSGTQQYLVKQVRKWDTDGRASLAREAAVYSQSRTNRSLAPVVALSPQCHAWDPLSEVLILAYLPGHTELYDLPDRFSPHFAQLAGQAMGVFHRAMRSQEFLPLFPSELPPHLSIHEVMDEDMTDASSGQRGLVRAVRKYPEFGPALDKLRADWCPRGVIQGDWKLDNCLISPERDRVRVVDWEFAGWGDPVWDLATLLQSYWNFWVLRPAEYRIEEIQPALRAVLKSYDQTDVAERAIRFAGARMLQTAFEHLERRIEMTADAVRLMQASLNILTRPEWSARQLLGTE